MYSVESLVEKLYEIEPGLTVVLQDQNGNEFQIGDLTVQDDKLVIVPCEVEDE